MVETDRLYRSNRFHAVPINYACPECGERQGMIIHKRNNPVPMVRNSPVLGLRGILLVAGIVYCDVCFYPIVYESPDLASPMKLNALNVSALDKPYSNTLLFEPYSRICPECKKTIIGTIIFRKKNRLQSLRRVPLLVKNHVEIAMGVVRCDICAKEWVYKGTQEQTPY